MTTTATHYHDIDTLVGRLRLAGDEHSVRQIQLPNRAEDEPSQNWKRAEEGALPGPLAAAKEQLQEYFAGERREFDLPLGPEGDVAVLGDVRTVIGAREVDHDLSGLKGHRLRTHGSVHEADVPIILSRPVSDEHARRAEDARLHSYEAFDYAFNGIVD